MSEGSKEHDWKSCIPLKGIVGSNPTLSATQIPTEPAMDCWVFFCHFERSFNKITGLLTSRNLQSKVINIIYEQVAVVDRFIKILI